MSMDTYGIIGFTTDNVGIDRRFYTGRTDTDPTLAVSYNERRVDVYLNGIKLVGDHPGNSDHDYDIDAQTGQGSSITLRTGVDLVATDVIECIGYVSLSGNTVTSHNPTPTSGDGGFNEFRNIGQASSDLLNVYLNGVLLDDSDYTSDPTTNGGTVTIGGATLTANDIVVIQVIGTLNNSNFVPAGGGAFTGPITGVDVNGTELVLDADGDTSITADTDDRIDIKIGGTDDVQIKPSQINITAPSSTNDSKISFFDHSPAVKWTVGMDNSDANRFKIVAGTETIANTDAVLVAENSTKNVTVENGNLVFGGAGKGVYLGVTSATDSNLLNDYEEGTWSARCADHSSTGNLSDRLPDTNSNWYIKIGDIVHCHVSFSNIMTTNNSGTNPTGNFFIQGLPFTPVDYAGMSSAVWVQSISSLSEWLVARVGSSGAIDFQKINANAVDTALTWSNLSNLSDMRLMVTYKAA